MKPTVSYTSSTEKLESFQPFSSFEPSSIPGNNKDQHVCASLYYFAGVGGRCLNSFFHGLAVQPTLIILIYTEKSFTAMRDGSKWTIIQVLVELFVYHHHYDPHLSLGIRIYLPLL